MEEIIFCFQVHNDSVTPNRCELLNSYKNLSEPFFGNNKDIRIESLTGFPYAGVLHFLATNSIIATRINVQSNRWLNMQGTITLAEYGKSCNGNKQTSPIRLMEQEVVTDS